MRRQTVLLDNLVIELMHVATLNNVLMIDDIVLLGDIIKDVIGCQQIFHPTQSIQGVLDLNMMMSIENPENPQDTWMSVVLTMTKDIYPRLTLEHTCLHNLPTSRPKGHQ